jgi:hypothetical protein
MSGWDEIEWKNEMNEMSERMNKWIKKEVK